ncbi:MAG TPA: DNA repair protein RecO [Candidatus Nitrosocosmicus sp.]|nr:DNA repair protein RecO [Candidatus Nitrosocosmicus sp.]
MISTSDTGIILTKKNFLKNDKLIILFSETQGKIGLLAKGIKSITSKRLSHLETGNYINISFTSPVGHTIAYLQETELIYGYSKIKSDSSKIKVMYQIFFILNQLLPEGQPEEQIFKKTLQFLKLLNNNDSITPNDLKNYLNSILISGGYVNTNQINNDYFDPNHFIEELIQKKVIIPTF